MIGHLLLAFLIQQASSAILNNCKYHQHLQNGKMKLTSPGYPDPYAPGTTCQWTTESPPTTVINVECQISMSSMNDCNNNKVGISDNSDLISARYYCTSGEFSYNSRSGTLIILLETSSTAPGGTIFCTLEVQSSGPIHTTLIKVEEPIPPPKVDSPPVRPPAKCSCGRTNSPKVLAGEEVTMNEFPMMAGIVMKDTKQMFCGGTIISPSFVMTAAHCFHTVGAEDVMILVGGHNHKQGTPYHEYYDVADTFKYPRHRKIDLKHDILLIKTMKPMVFSYGVGSACLPFKFIEEDLMSVFLTVIGWGLHERRGTAGSLVLQAVELQVVPISKCKYFFGNSLDTTEICTFSEGRNSCKGDSGGPVLLPDPDTGAIVVVGIVSGGTGCSPTAPNIHTKVSAYLDWILSVTGDSFCRI